MTRKDFEALAAILNDCIKENAISKLGAETIAKGLEKRFANFNYDQFMRAVLA